LDQGDGDFDHEEVQDKIDYQESKKEKYRNIEKQLQQSGEKQISLTDPDAKSVVLHRNIVQIAILNIKIHD